MLHMSIQVWRRHPAFPAQWLYGLYVIVLGTGFLATIVRSKRWPLTNLTPAPGRRTQTISPYASAALVSRCLTSTAPCPSFATMAYAPLMGQDGGSYGVDLPDGASDLFLTPRLDGPNRIEFTREIRAHAQGGLRIRPTHFPPPACPLRYREQQPRF